MRCIILNDKIDKKIYVYCNKKYLERQYIVSIIFPWYIIWPPVSTIMFTKLVSMFKRY